MNHPQSTPNSPNSNSNGKLEKCLIYDYESGYVIDPATGEVVDRIYVYENYTKDEDGNRVLAHCHMSKESSPTHPLYLPLRKYLGNLEILGYLDIVRKELKVPISDYEFEANLRYITKKLGRHLRTREFKIALLYITLESMHVPVDEKTIAELFNVSRFKLKSEIIKLKRELSETGMKKEPGSITEKMTSYISMYGMKMNLPKEVISEAVAIATSKPYPFKYTPKTLALALLYKVITKHNIIVPSKENGYKTALSIMKETLNLGNTNISSVAKFVEKYYFGGNDVAPKA